MIDGIDLTARLRHVLASARSAADTEHLLLGLCAEGQGVGAQVLVWAGLTTDGARAKLQQRAVR
jgi:hypothetical protein